MLGTVIGNYRLLRQLGEGGMGVVYLAEHTLLGRRAAIKVLLPSLSARPDVITRFFNEARAATSIGDPGIVQVFDFGQHTDGSAYLVMELLDGEPVDRRLARLGRLAPADALRIGRQIATTLDAAHAKGIIHRDLKPENVFLVRDPEVAGGERAKVLDFGIAKLTGGDPNLSKTQTGALMGTPIYMSPEQCRGAADLDHRSDIYALGCVLDHLLTGKPPFVAGGLGELLGMHMIVPAPAPSERVPELGPELDALVLRCLAKRPDDRFQTMAEVATAIDGILAGIAPPAGSGWRTPVPPPPGVAGSWPGLTPPPPAPTAASWPGSPPAPAAPTSPGAAEAAARSRTPTTLGSASAETIAAPATMTPPARGRWGLKLGAAATVVALGVGAVWLLGARTGGPGRASTGEPTAATPGGSGGGAATAGSVGGEVKVGGGEVVGAVPAVVGGGGPGESAAGAAGAVIDAGVDGAVAEPGAGPTLPTVTGPIAVGPTTPASPPQRHDRRQRRAPGAGTATPPPTEPTAPAPPPARPGCKLDENGVPVERC